jgi:ubiquinone/menaquinone biosynthesis C-methylase UbiE
MYSEQDDFKEKGVAYQRMMAELGHLDGSMAIGNIKLALEVGGSGGLLAGIVSQNGPRVLCTDIVDVQSQYNGEFSRLLKEKFARNGYELDLGKIEFHTMNAHSLLYGDNKFDIVFSLNALEHIPDPILAIKEMWRVLKPGAMLYASFDPVWTADSGSHFIHYTQEPWLHLILDDDEYCSAMQRAGAAEWELDEYRCAMNRLPATFYMQEFKTILKNLFSKYSLTHWSGCVRDENFYHENKTKAASLTGLTPQDLMVRGFQIVALK